MSIRISRQPSTYGALHDMVETKKLGGGVIRGLVGEQQWNGFCVPRARASDAVQNLHKTWDMTDMYVGRCL